MGERRRVSDEDFLRRCGIAPTEIGESPQPSLTATALELARTAALERCRRHGIEDPAEVAREIEKIIALRRRLQ
jgi:hypothetical protein